MLLKTHPETPTHKHETTALLSIYPSSNFDAGNNLALALACGRPGVSDSGTKSLNGLRLKTAPGLAMPEGSTLSVLALDGSNATLASELFLDDEGGVEIEVPETSTWLWW